SLTLRLFPGVTFIPYTTLFRSHQGEQGNRPFRPSTNGPPIQTRVYIKNRVGHLQLLGHRRPKGKGMGRYTGWQHTRHGFSTGDKDRKSTRLNSSHVKISYAVFC